MFQSFLPLENENKNLCSARCNSVDSSRLFLVRNVDRAGFVFIIDVNLFQFVCCWCLFSLYKIGWCWWCWWCEQDSALRDNSHLLPPQPEGWAHPTVPGSQWSGECCLDCGGGSLLHSHWSRNVQARLSLVESFRCQSVATPAVLCQKEPVRRPPF